MIKSSIAPDTLFTIFAVSSNPKKYAGGILLNDIDSQNQVEILSHIQAIIMQSLQVKNSKRALRYIVAFYALSRKNKLLEERLKESITEKIIS